MGLQLNACGFDLLGYRVLWTSYIEQVVAQDEGGTQEDAVENVLSFFAANYLDALGDRAAPLICEARDIDGLELPEIYALVVPNDRLIIFGTESEIRTTAENIP